MNSLLENANRIAVVFVAWLFQVLDESQVQNVVQCICLAHSFRRISVEGRGRGDGGGIFFGVAGRRILIFSDIYSIAFGNVTIRYCVTRTEWRWHPFASAIKQFAELSGAPLRNYGLLDLMAWHGMAIITRGLSI